MYQTLESDSAVSRLIKGHVQKKILQINLTSNKIIFKVYSSIYIYLISILKLYSEFSNISKKFIKF